MKKLVLMTLLVFASVLPQFSSAKTVLKYQVLVSDENGSALVDTPVTFNVSIRQGSASGDVVMAEKIGATTSAVGVADFNIGEQSSTVSLDDLDWAGDVYFLDLSIDRGNGMQNLGCTQIMSVPRAIYASSASELILRSPSGKRFKVVIDDNGEVSTQPVN